MRVQGGFLMDFQPMINLEYNQLMILKMRGRVYDGSFFYTAIFFRFNNPTSTATLAPGFINKPVLNKPFVFSRSKGLAF
tara:strand:- start:1804 stop:2040 length:237 start_codon:yes stop_codon:yes gene_type:complete